jgi:magnesium transporter
MKLFSWAAIVFLPPTLIAGIYGMNFDYLPELKWHFGYFMALGAMLASAILPWAYFKWRRWI